MGNVLEKLGVHIVIKAAMLFPVIINVLKQVGAL